MKPVKFKGSNIVLGEKQPQYQPLPAMIFPDGTVITCWELTEEEIENVRKTGKIFLNQLTFNKPLQPILPMVELDDNLGISPDFVSGL